MVARRVKPAGMPPLRPYQLAPAAAIVRSVVNGDGLSFSVEMARQAGKNEVSAQVELMLLAHCLQVGWERSGIKCAPTLVPQVRTSMLRLLLRLRQAGLSELVHTADGWRVVLGQSWMGFLSADPDANVVGQTASLILEVDEAQDVGAEKFDKEFKPMASSTNATTVYWGTAWSDDDLLERAKQEHLQLTRLDGIQRHFEVGWREVAAVNPAYGRYVEGEIARLGPTHPIIQTQYELKTLPGQGRLFNSTDRALLQGAHGREDAPVAGAAYVASLDIGGTGELAGTTSHDSTVLAVGRLGERAGVGAEDRQTLDLVRLYQWAGVPIAERDAAVLTLLARWAPGRVVVDATGLGETLAVVLVGEFGASVVEAFKFTGPSKSALGYALLGAVRSGRVRVFAGDGSPEYVELWRQLAAARSEFLPNKLMRFYVPDDEGHDDMLVSLALLVRAAESGRPAVARGYSRG